MMELGDLGVVGATGERIHHYLHCFFYLFRGGII